MASTGQKSSGYDCLPKGAPCDTFGRFLQYFRVQLACLNGVFRTKKPFLLVTFIITPALKLLQYRVKDPESKMRSSSAFRILSTPVNFRLTLVSFHVTRLVNRSSKEFMKPVLISFSCDRIHISWLVA